MKKLKVILILLMFVEIADAQIYISSFCGYSISTNPTKVENIVAIDTVLNAYHTTIPYGKGLNIGIGTGYEINKNLAIEVLFTYQVSSEIKYDNDWGPSFVGHGNVASQSELYGKGTIKNKTMQIVPMLIYKIQVNNLEPYLKAGINFLFTKANHYNYISGISDMPIAELRDSYETDYVKTGRWDIGFRGACGINKQLNKHFAVYGEIMVVNTNYSYKKKEITMHKVSGVDITSSITNKVTEYNDDSEMIDYSHLGINIGLKYLISKQ